MNRKNLNYSHLTLLFALFSVITSAPAFAQNGKKTEVVTQSSTPLNGKTADSGQDSTDVSVMKKIMKEMSIASADVKDALAEARNELGIDWDKLKAEIERGLEDVDRELNGKELREDISRGVKKGLESGKEALEQAKKQLEESKKALADARAAKAAKNNGYEPMLTKMEKDGLINRSEKYKIEKDSNGLYINGKKQTETVNKKYLTYLKEKKVSINGYKDSLNIKIND